MAQPLFKIRLFYPCGIFKRNFKDVRRLRNQRRLNPYLYMDFIKHRTLFFIFSNPYVVWMLALLLAACSGSNNMTL
jgi:hypothetical protein